MNRRNFVKNICELPIAVFGLTSVYALFADTAQACESQIIDGLKSFGFYQGLGPNEQRSSGRSDGTYFKMPCIGREDVDAGVAKTYEFWHGHGSAVHRFTVSEENFAVLQRGESVEIYTDIVTGHRHALKITADLACDLSEL